MHNVVGTVGYALIAALAVYWGLTWWQALIVMILTVIVAYTKAWLIEQEESQL